jgi:hypothetical protein
MQKPFGFGGDIGLRVSSSSAPADVSPGWRTSTGRDQPRSPWPRVGQVALAVAVVAAMAVGLHFFFY